MRKIILSAVILLLFFIHSQAQIQEVQDDFEGNGTITTWYGDNCNINTSFTNPYQQGINNSSTVMQYDDVGGQYANVRFDISETYDLYADPTFSLKIYVPSSGITGTQPNQVSLKLQDGTLTEPWLTQCDIIKPILLDQWQSITFDFLNDTYINFDPNSPPPTQRTDFNRVLIQVNGENNYDFVLAYIDDVKYGGSIPDDPEYDVLVWSDEFDTNGAVDNTKWHHETKMPNPWGWHGGEVQHYTNRTDNSYVSNGILNIVGKKETYTDQGITKEYTSARLNSKFAFQYGKVEVRAKLPPVAGTLPAIWMLGKNFNVEGIWWEMQGYGTTDWPDCGEIDIMEHWGSNQNHVSSATHTPSSYGATVNVGEQIIPTATTEFHTYMLQWYPKKLVFSVDGITHFIYQPNEINSDTWPFNAEQFLLLNFALLPDIDPAFVADTFKVDYVRVYQSQPTGIDLAEDSQQSFDLNNVPNPADDYTLINYHLPMNSDVQLFIHDINGRLIQTLINEKQNAGQHQVRWDVKNLPSGVYIYTLQTEGNTITRKCIVEK
jgi:beta-glucanase (GH16 family)